MSDVITDITKRWVDGIDHHPKAVEIAKIISDLDFKYGNNALDLSFGGDGDNGEHLLYLLSIHFELEEQNKDGDA